MENNLATKEGKKKALINLILSIGGIAVFNGIIQFVLYPFLNRQVGDATFGVILTMISVMSIISSSAGAAVNNARMVAPFEKTSKNGDYNIILLIFNLIGIAVIIIFLSIIKQLAWYNVVLLNLLMFVTTYRYYSDCEFRKNLKFGSFFIYYLLIGVGYIIGCLIYKLLPYWQISMFIGEVLALGFVMIKGTIYKKPFATSNVRNKVWLLSISLLIGEIINNLILNSDRILLYLFVSDEAVTKYYIASLVGKIVALVTVPLNGVVISYLSRQEKTPSKKFILIYLSSVIGLGILAFIGCLIFSPIIIKLLYPDSYEGVKGILITAIIAQVAFFCSTLAMSLIIKYMHSRVQLFINIIHLIIFVTITILGSYYGGLVGFSIAALVGNIIRFFMIASTAFFIKSGIIIKINNRAEELIEEEEK